MADEIEIVSARKPLEASLELPGSKSITNRALLLAAMCAGRSQIDSGLFSEDTRQMAQALRELGFRVDADQARKRFVVEGRGGAIAATSADLNVGGAGTAMRFLAGFLTLGRGRYRIDGNERMRQRPIGGLLDALKALGLSAESERANGCPPIVIDNTQAAPFEGGSVQVDARESSQFVSALLMPAPLWRAGLRLRVIGQAGKPFVTLTLRMMEQWGAESRVEADTIIVPGGQSYGARRFDVEPDASAAGYFAAAAALVGGRVRIHHLRRDSLQGDVGFLEVLARMGAGIRWHLDGVEVEGRGRLQGVDVDMSAMPDMAATLAAIAPFASSPTRIRNVAFIRHHESDRIRAVVTELKRLGAAARELDDGMLIEPSALKPAPIETYDDHRIAMSFAVVGLKLAGLRIRNPSCVSKTFPDFFERLAALTD